MNAIVFGERDVAEALTKGAVDAGVNAYEIINAICEGLKVVGEKYEAKEFFIPDLVASADAAMTAKDIIKPRIKTEKMEFTGTYIIGTVEGDFHEIGKDLVVMMLEAGGFKVIDLGVDTPAKRFVEAAIQYNADIVGSSANIFGGIRIQQKEIEKALRNAGIRNKVKTMIGGILTDETWAREIGADAWGKDYIDALKKAKELMKKLKEERK
jgi:methanogenic corrinoid protein MtbC1